MDTLDCCLVKLFYVYYIACLKILSIIKYHLVAIDVRIVILGCAVIQLPEMLASIYAFLRTKFRLNAANISESQSRLPSKEKITSRFQARSDCISVVDANVLKAIKEEVSKAVLDIIDTKLDIIDKPIDDIKMHL